MCWYVVLFVNISNWDSDSSSVSGTTTNVLIYTIHSRHAVQYLVCGVYYIQYYTIYTVFTIDWSGLECDYLPGDQSYDFCWSRICVRTGCFNIMFIEIPTISKTDFWSSLCSNQRMWINRFNSNRISFNFDYLKIWQNQIMWLLFYWLYEVKYTKQTPFTM